MLRITSCSVVLLVFIASVYSTDYFVEKFEDESYKNRWVQSTAKSDLGEFKLSHGKFYGDAKKDLGKTLFLLIFKIRFYVFFFFKAFKHLRTLDSMAFQLNSISSPTKAKRSSFNLALNTNRKSIAAVVMSKSTRPISIKQVLLAIRRITLCSDLIFAVMIKRKFM